MVTPGDMQVQRCASWQKFSNRSRAVIVVPQLPRQVQSKSHPNQPLLLSAVIIFLST